MCIISRTGIVGLLIAHGLKKVCTGLDLVLSSMTYEANLSYQIIDLGRHILQSS